MHLVRFFRRARRAVPTSFFLALSLWWAFTCAAPDVMATSIIIVPADPPGVGFNDPSSADPVGGNTGVTVGEQRLIALQHAANIWAGVLESDVTIPVRVSWQTLSCDATSGFIGFAGPWGTSSDFPGAVHPETWYPIALANKLAQDDLDPSSPDISASFNIAVGTPDCLANSTWYYGLDNNAAPSEIDLVTTALHEIAHGLGALDFVNHSNGQLMGDQIDVYSRLIFDNTLGKHWGEMTNGERAASAVNEGNVIWNGTSVSAQAASFLGNRPMFEVNAPESIAGTYTIRTAAFGPYPSLTGVTGDLILVDDGIDDPADACEPIGNDVELAGNIALIDRGSCTFTSKVKAAQDAGAVAAVVVNHTAGAGVITMGGADETITIPAVMISLEDGNTLKSELASGVNASLFLHPTFLAGADDNGKVLLYAPDPIVSGSSIVHWDFSATPDLLMEPNIPSDIPQNGDLTVELFRDIGWFEPSVPVAVTDMSLVSTADAVVLSWRFNQETLRDLAGVGVQRATSPEGPYRNLTPQALSPALSMAFEDVDVREAEWYWYRLFLVWRSGAIDVSRTLNAIHSTGVARAELMQPVETSTGEVELRVRVGHPSVPVRLEIYDVGGRRVRTLELGQRDRGAHGITWDRRDADARRAARGIYLVRMVAGTSVHSRKLVLIN